MSWLQPLDDGSDWNASLSPRAHVSKLRNTLSLDDLSLLVVLPLLAATILAAVQLTYLTNDGIPTVNRKFSLEPRVFARLRWAIWAREILEDAKKYKNQVFRLARGDVDLLVLPAKYTAELNKLSHDEISSRRSHASTLIGQRTGIDVVLQTDHHVKILLGKITPALPKLLPHAAPRVQQCISSLFPQSTAEWSAVKPLDKVVLCISRSLAVALFGEPTCDDPELIQTFMHHTQNLFSTAFAMRLVPWLLQPLLVWFYPGKWRLRKTWQVLRRYCDDEIDMRTSDQGSAPRHDMMSCMLQDSSERYITDRKLVTGLLGSTVAGATYSSAAMITGVIFDLVSHPHFLEEIRQEIRDTHKRVDGNWDFDAFSSLVKLESAMNETVRLAPGTMVVYSRVMNSDHTLSNGISLKKDQFICISAHERATNDELYPDPQQYDALRDWRLGQQDGRRRVFASNHAPDYRFGAGRWSCPGRYIASLSSKMILVKLLDEYDFAFIGGSRPKNSVLHEFVFVHPEEKLYMKRRGENSGISY